MPRAIDATPEPIELIDWGAFQLAMMTNQAYYKVSKLTDNQRAVSRIETYFSSEVENWPVAAQLWSQMLQGCPSDSLPTAEDAVTWGAIAQSTNMPIEFTTEGYLKPKTGEE